MPRMIRVIQFVLVHSEETRYLMSVATAGIRLSRPYAVHLVVGEEDGGLGAFATLERGHRG